MRFSFLAGKRRRHRQPRGEKFFLVGQIRPAFQSRVPAARTHFFVKTFHRLFAFNG